MALAVAHTCVLERTQLPHSAAPHTATVHARQTLLPQRSGWPSLRSRTSNGMALTLTPLGAACSLPRNHDVRLDMKEWEGWMEGLEKLGEVDDVRARI